MRGRFRFLLPVVFGFTTVGLMVWQHHNQGIIESMGMSWDTGAPVWPYQTGELVLIALNLPAFFLAAPLFFLLPLYTLEMRYPVLLPIIVVWWWWIGTRLDFGVLGDRRFRRPRLFAFFLATAAAGLLATAVYVGIDEFRSWWRYEHFPSLVRAAGAMFWSLALSAGCLIAVRRLLQSRLPDVTDDRPKRRVFAIGMALSTLIAVAIALRANTSKEVVDPDSCLVDSDTGCIHGTVWDENGRAVSGLMLELLPAEKAGDARWYSRIYEWTDDTGRYSFNRVPAGGYVLSVHYYDAPHADEPFATMFYPGVETERGASRLIVTAGFPMMVKPLRMRTLPLRTIKIKVIWADGTSPEQSNLSFHNLSYPQQAVISDVAPQVSGGRGEFTLPEGFDYEARASVSCDAGETIETRESKPVQHISVRDGTTPSELTFTIPGAPCKLWVPK